MITITCTKRRRLIRVDVRSGKDKVGDEYQQPVGKEDSVSQCTSSALSCLFRINIIFILEINNRNTMKKKGIRCFNSYSLMTYVR